MPCDSIIRHKVKLEVADRNLLKKALVRLGYQITSETKTQIQARDKNWRYLTISNGEIEYQISRGQEKKAEEWTSQINRAYSIEVVRETADQFNMELEFTSDFEGTLEVSRY